MDEHGVCNTAHVCAQVKAELALIRMKSPKCRVTFKIYDSHKINTDIIVTVYRPFTVTQ